MSTVTPKHLKVREVADELGICLSAAYDLIRTRKITSRSFGTGRGAIRVSREDLDRFIQSRTNPAEQASTKRKRRQLASFPHLEAAGFRPDLAPLEQQP